MNKTIADLIQFIHKAEKLKAELRHSWLSNGRHESVAEHSWRLGLMVILFAPHLHQPIDLEKALKMAILHDIVEIVTGDQPFFAFYDDQEKKDLKKKAESQAIEELKELLPPINGESLFTVWHEYEERKSLEAKFVCALDKMEAQIQHNEADLSTWVEGDMKHVRTYLDPYCDFNEFLTSVKKEVQQESINKLQTVYA